MIKFVNAGLAAGVLLLACTPAVFAAEPVQIAGCYQVTSGLPDGYSVSWCLTADFGGEFTSIAPQGTCVRTMNWAPYPGGEPTARAWPDHYIHLNVNWFSVGCPDHAAVLTDDIYCDGAGTCFFDEESGPRSYTVPLRQVTVAR